MSDLRADIDAELGIKRLTLENWLEVDHNSSIWARPSIVGAIPITARDWTERLLAVELDDTVPVNVRRLFAVARGTMVYGSLFYPLWAVGSERLFTTADAAVSVKYEAHGGSKTSKGRLPSYNDRLTWLRDGGLLDAAAFERWDLLRELRNAAAHPEAPDIFPPTYAMQFLVDIARQINALFA